MSEGQPVERGINTSMLTDINLNNGRKILPKSTLPKTLKKLELVPIRDFLKSYRTYERQVGEENVQVEDYIQASLWAKMSRRRKKIFKEDNSEEILIFLEDLLKELKEEKLEYLARRIRNIAFKDGKSTFYKSLVYYIEKSEELTNDAIDKAKFKDESQESIDTEETSDTEDSISEKVQKNVKRILKKTLEGMPKQTKISIENYYDNSIKTIEELRKKVKDMKQYFIGERYNPKYKEEEYDLSCTDSDDSDEDSDDSTTKKVKKNYRKLKRQVAKKKLEDLKKKEANNIVQVSEVSGSLSKSILNDVDQVEELRFITAFLMEEAKCHDSYLICYGCKKPGHIRPNCPNTSNRKGFQKKFFKVCWNCQGKGHIWHECTALPLKPHLLIRLQQRKMRLAQQQGTGIQNQNQNTNVNNNQNGNNGQNGNYGQNNGVLVETLVALLQQKNNLEVNSSVVSKRNNEVEEFKLNMPTSKDASTVQVVQMNNVDNKFNLIKSRIESDEQLFCKKDDEWVKVRGKADTGACTTVCSLVHHKGVMLSLWDICGQSVVIRVADGTLHKVTQKCLLHIKINDTDIGVVESLVIDLKGWVNVLVGLDVLQQRGLVVKTKK